MLHTCENRILQYPNIFSSAYKKYICTVEIQSQAGSSSVQDGWTPVHRSPAAALPARSLLYLIVARVRERHADRQGGGRERERERESERERERERERDLQTDRQTERQGERERWGCITLQPPSSAPSLKRENPLSRFSSAATIAKLFFFYSWKRAVSFPHKALIKSSKSARKRLLKTKEFFFFFFFFLIQPRGAARTGVSPTELKRTMKFICKTKQKCWKFTQWTLVVLCHTLL